jgi:prepilin-type N-terminal cleavage/methylation domain-containing protein
MLPRKGAGTSVVRNDHNSENGGGFTLIELLVVMAILALLATLLVPVVRRSTDMAHRVRCLSNLKQIGYAATLYANEHEDRKPPILGPKSWTTPNVKYNNEFTGVGILVDAYLDVHEMVLCPSIEPPSDVGNDRHMWLTASYVGSSYFYEWHHPYPTWKVETDEEIARFQRTSHLSTAPKNAIVMDINFEFWAQYRGPVRTHRRLGTANVLFGDASVGTFNQEADGLIVRKNDKIYPIWLVWEAAHKLRP